MLHIARQDALESAKRSGTYSLPGGLIHGCSRAQLAMVVAAHFASVEGWLLLTIDESKAIGEVRLVTHSNGMRTETFPHIHGSVPVSAVTKAETLMEALGNDS